MKPLPLALALILGLSAASLPAQETRWPLGEGVKSPDKALSMPTKLAPVSQSLTALLDAGGTIVSSYVAPTGPVVTLRLRKRFMICLLQGTNPATDQNVATSECYALN
ncbi:MULTISPECIES: hypothetical protein [unclassified Sphingomonas]|uniref:hypothetical protein n=1 Tax=unclassified Sphingomonas TaxID=196159 RepID=UPI0006F95A01|nr:MULTISPECIES: hypothetical protein [unclassified Sphingomonas]KQN04078.1 hypothetical protein ASE78_03335 [Sphingomonas sp. Leaf25]